ncbi:MAG TPA: redoxin domain-containing protein [Candidatus Xenobia bacterium]|nr:redoxin domain-containing protein [Candidatus Xenobia bacterium]
MRKLFVGVATLVILAGAAVVGWKVYSGPPAPPGQVAVGQAVADFTLPDINGQTHSLASLKGPKGVLLIWISVQCPYSNGYNARMEALHRDYSAKGIPVVGINSNRTEPLDKIREHAKQNGFTFTILKDDGNRIADYFGASVTPEAYLIDSAGVLRYHGRLDASHEDTSLNSGEAREALDAVLSGAQVANTGKKAFGCTIKRVSG